MFLLLTHRSLDSIAQRKLARHSATKEVAPPATMSEIGNRTGEAEAPAAEAPIVPEEVQQERPHRFITIPNIRSPRQQQERPARPPPEARVAPRVKAGPPPERIKIDKFVPSKKLLLQDQHQQANRQESRPAEIRKPPEREPKNSEPELEPASEPKATKVLAVDEKDMIDKCEGKSALVINLHDFILECSTFLKLFDSFYSNSAKM